jgi:hypothetical protein
MQRLTSLAAAELGDKECLLGRRIEVSHQSSVSAVSCQSDRSEPAAGELAKSAFSAGKRLRVVSIEEVSCVAGLVHDDVDVHGISHFWVPTLPVLTD